MGGVPWYAIVLMLAGPCLLGTARLLLTVGRLFGIGSDPRPGYLDLRRRR